MKKFLFSLILLACYSCINTLETPENLIPKDSLISIIVDLHLADAILLNPMVQTKISDISSNKLYETVMTKHKVTRQCFTESIQYYAKEPMVLDSIYDVVIEKLSIIESFGYKDSIP